MRNLTFAFLILISVYGQSFAQSPSVTSPDKNLSFTFNLQDTPDGRTGVMFYDITYKGQSVIENSEMGLIMTDRNGDVNKDWISDILIKNTRTTSQDTLWKPVYGERNSVPDRYNALTVDLIFSEQKESDDPQVLQLIVRAYNEGIAFQYFWPENTNTQNLWVAEEKTHFTFPQNTKGWFTHRAQAEYELRPLQNWDRPTEMPLTLQLPNGLFACVAEAHMVNYSRARLMTVPDKPNTVVTTLESGVRETSPFGTPWRVVMVAEKSVDLLQNNDLILNLNPPNQIAHTWWIRPGKVIREMTLTTEASYELVDFAADHGLDYILYDAGWYGNQYLVGADATTITVDTAYNAKGNLDLHGVIQYAKSKGIGVILYVNHRALERDLDKILSTYKEWGVEGVKFGFVHVGTHRWVTWLYDAVRRAADYQIMVDVHDEFRPTGYSRTYPNLMTQEGIHGNESMPDARNNTILPFTRFIAGAADYTFAYYYREELKEASKYIKNTPAHQLALPVIYYSPWQFMYWYDIPSRDYQGEPELEFWAHCPTVWDDTKVLQGEIGEFTVIARQSGEEWYLGAITNTEARKLDIKLDFLPENKTYVAHIYTDGGNEVKTRTHVKIEHFLVSKSSAFKTALKASGGAAVRFVPATSEDQKLYSKLP